MDEWMDYELSTFIAKQRRRTGLTVEQAARLSKLGTEVILLSEKQATRLPIRFIYRISVKTYAKTEKDKAAFNMIMNRINKGADAFYECPGTKFLWKLVKPLIKLYDRFSDSRFF